MKQARKWISSILIGCLIFSGCTNQLTSKNPLEQELLTSSFQAMGEMIYNGESYTIRLSRTSEEKIVVLGGELLSSPLCYTLDEKGLNITDGSLEGMVIPVEKMPEDCVGVFLWQYIEELAKGSRVEAEKGIEVVLQDVGMLTADEGKKITSLTFPSIAMEITLNQFEYC